MRSLISWQEAFFVCWKLSNILDDEIIIYEYINYILISGRH